MTSRPRDERAERHFGSGLRETSRRPLRIFAFDPMTDRFRDPIVAQVPFERVTPGPTGRLVQVIDLDVARGRYGAPFDLDAPDVLIGRGLAPSESDERFHQQMVYAVAMRVLEAFERGLGRPLVWDQGKRLRLLPHAMFESNVYFLPETFSLQFGYFDADRHSPGADNLAGQTIYTCLTYDVIAHETCHPVLYTLRPGDLDGGSSDDGHDLDTIAFHEAMSDLVALLVRFDEADVVARAIRTGGVGLVYEPLLSIAMQFGQAAATGAAVRTYPDKPDPERYRTEEEPHARGALLVSAVIEALLHAYREATGDLKRLHGPETDGGWVHPDLVRRLADEAARLANDLLRASIAALDYLPPRTVRFSDYLRALLTTDTLMFGRSHSRLRAHLIEAFHRRGMIPATAGSLAEDALLLPLVPENTRLQLPHAGDALLHTVRATEWRRQHMIEPSRLDRATKTLRAEERARERTWLPAIEAFARSHAGRLGLDPGRPIKASGLAGSYQTDAGGGLTARVVVQLLQGHDRKRPRGVTVICDSEGTVLHLIRAGHWARRPKRASANTVPSEHADLVRSLEPFHQLDATD